MENNSFPASCLWSEILHHTWHLPAKSLGWNNQTSYPCFYCISRCCSNLLISTICKVFMKCYSTTISGWNSMYGIIVPSTVSLDVSQPLLPIEGSVPGSMNSLHLHRNEANNIRDASAKLKPSAATKPVVHMHIYTLTRSNRLLPGICFIFSMIIIADKTMHFGCIVKSSSI